MALLSAKEIKQMLRKNGLRPKKSLGQNFLIDRHILDEIIKAGSIKKNDTIIEIGSGTGILTKELARRAKKVITFEKDKLLTQVLQKELQDFSNTTILQQDFLRFKIPVRLKYKIIANIPYNITSSIIRKLLGAENKPVKIILMTQFEVAKRICGKIPRMSILSNSVQLYGRPKIISRVPKDSFWPKPKVDSAVLEITEIKKPNDVPENALFNLLRAGFSSPRKQIINNLSNGLHLSKGGVRSKLIEMRITPVRRAETLTLDEWKKLANDNFFKKNP